MQIVKLKFVLLTFLLLTLGLVKSVYAEDTYSPTPKPSPRFQRQDIRQDLKAGLNSADEKFKLRSCEVRVDSVKKRAASLEKLVVNMESKFDQIAKRIQEYYANKLVPNGKNISNYDALVSDITNKKSAVDTALATAKSTTPTFNCEENKPKELLTTYRENMQNVKKALQDYRTSVRNLIVAVRNVTGNKSPEATSVVTTTP